jgi:hypothetical protein
LAEILPAAGGVDPFLPAGQQPTQGQGQGVDREVAAAQIAFQIRGAQAHQIQEAPLAQGQAAGGLVLLQGDEARAHLGGQLTPQGQGVAADGQVQVGGAEAQQQVAGGAAGEPDSLAALTGQAVQGMQDGNELGRQPREEQGH